MEELILENPTVRDLIRALQKLDQDKYIILKDTDTGFYIPIIHIDEFDKGTIELSGRYEEMRHS